MSSDVDLVIPDDLAALALAALAHGMGCRQDSETLTPFVMIESGGERYLRRLDAESDEAVLADAQALLARETDSTSAYALAYDGNLTAEGVAYTAVMAIVGVPGPSDAFVFAQRYDETLTPFGSPALIGQHDSLIDTIL